MFFQGKKLCDTLSDLANKTQVNFKQQYKNKLRNNLRNNLGNNIWDNLRDTSCSKRMFFQDKKPCDTLYDLANKTQVNFKAQYKQQFKGQFRE